jgi:hypothetical protein
MANSCRGRGDALQKLLRITKVTCGTPLQQERKLATTEMERPRARIGILQVIDSTHGNDINDFGKQIGVGVPEIPWPSFQLYLVCIGRGGE